MRIQLCLRVLLGRAAAARARIAGSTAGSRPARLGGVPLPLGGCLPSEHAATTDAGSAPQSLHAAAGAMQSCSSLRPCAARNGGQDPPNPRCPSPSPMGSWLALAGSRTWRWSAGTQPTPVPCAYKYRVSRYLSCCLLLPQPGWLVPQLPPSGPHHTAPALPSVAAALHLAGY